MDDGGIWGFLLLVVLAVVFRFVAGRLDHERIKEYIEGVGGRVQSIHWDPFGPGWFGEESDRIYQVCYVDAEGNVHETHCKTSLMTSVYFTEDHIARSSFRPLKKAAPHESYDVDAIVAENTRLREEVERLRRRDA